jgi:hypothetical protein
VLRSQALTTPDANGKVTLVETEDPGIIAAFNAAEACIQAQATAAA